MRTATLLDSATAAHQAGGNFLQAASLYREAIEALVNAANTSELPPKHRESLAVARLGLASCALRTRQGLEEAILECSAMLEADAGDARALFRRAMLNKELACTGRSSRLSLARDDLLEAVRLEPRNSRMLAALRLVENLLLTAPKDCQGVPANRSLDHDNSHGATAWAAQRSAWRRASLGLRCASSEDVERGPPSTSSAGTLKAEHRTGTLEVTEEEEELLRQVLSAETSPFPPLAKRVPLSAMVRCAVALWPPEPLGAPRAKHLPPIGAQGALPRVHELAFEPSAPF